MAGGVPGHVGEPWGDWTLFWEVIKGNIIKGNLVADYGILELWGIMITADGIMDIMVSWISVMVRDEGN